MLALSGCHIDCGTTLSAKGTPSVMLPAPSRLMVPGWKTVPFLNCGAYVMFVESSNGLKSPLMIFAFGMSA